MPPKQPPQPDLEERNTQIALFRYGLIAHLLFDPLPLRVHQGWANWRNTPSGALRVCARYGVSTIR